MGPLGCPLRGSNFNYSGNIYVMLAMFDGSTCYLAGPESINPYSEAHNMYAPVHADRGSFGHEYHARKRNCEYHCCLLNSQGELTHSETLPFSEKVVLRSSAFFGQKKGLR